MKELGQETIPQGLVESDEKLKSKNGTVLLFLLFHFDGLLNDI
jgi:hypothetical protein